MKEQKDRKNLTVLALESSCDETACAVVKNGREILANVIGSQAQLHAEFGGVVPEIASRLHVEAVLPVIDKALKQAGLTLADIDIFASTAAPGLIGALLIGVCAAKSLALSQNKPCLAVHHLAGHIASNYLSYSELNPPFLCLIVSGGHSQLVYVKDWCEFEIAGDTRDDAAGEAFDKIARALDLPYPGGPQIDLLAQKGCSDIYKFPKVKFKDGSADFSFSGVKTAALTFINKLKQEAKIKNVDYKTLFKIEDFAASYQAAVIEALLDNALDVMEKLSIKKFAVAGGVSANSALRKLCEEKFAIAKSYELYYPHLKFCTDNAAMIASMAYFQFLNRGYTAEEKNLSFGALSNISISDYYKR